MRARFPTHAMLPESGCYLAMHMVFRTRAASCERVSPAEIFLTVEPEEQVSRQLHTPAGEVTPLFPACIPLSLAARDRYPLVGQKNSGISGEIRRKRCVHATDATGAQVGRQRVGHAGQRGGDSVLGQEVGAQRCVYRVLAHACICSMTKHLRQHSDTVATVREHASRK